MTSPAKACDLAIERSFAQRDWKKVVMYSINPTQFLFYEFHGEWEEIKTGLLHRSCQELRAGYAECLATLEGKLADITTGETVNTVSDLVANQCAAIADPSLKHLTTYVVPRMPPEANYAISDPEKFASFATAALRGYRAESEEANQNLEQLIDKELSRQKRDMWQFVCGCPARCPGCGTKCTRDSCDHTGMPHVCGRHIFPAFNGILEVSTFKPLLRHCRSYDVWKVRRTSSPEMGGKVWPDFCSFLKDEHPDWLDPETREPPESMAPNHAYGEDATDIPTEIANEIDDNRRAWANCHKALVKLRPHMVDDTELPWLELYTGDGALTEADAAPIWDELFSVRPDAVE
jgi:hypothetical protein